jgi:SAM-dependent methyltransferase
MEDRWFGKFDWVNASHVLEHLRRIEAVDAVKHWTRLLKVGGKITIHVPNIERAMRLILDPPNNVAPGEKSYWWAQVYGDQAEDGQAWQHRNGFTPRKLEGLMQQIPGLTDVKVEEEDGGQNLKVTGTLSTAFKHFNLSEAWDEIEEKECQNSSPSQQLALLDHQTEASTLQESGLSVAPLQPS